MSHFYSGCQGGRGEATRCGHKTTGIEAYIQTSACGIRITADHDPETGIDEFRVQVYGGWHGKREVCTPLRVASLEDKATIFHDVKTDLPGTKTQHNVTAVSYTHLTLPTKA